MTTTIQIRAEIETAKKFKRLCEIMKESDKNQTQGSTFDAALDLLEKSLEESELRNMTHFTIKAKQ